MHTTPSLEMPTIGEHRRGLFDGVVVTVVASSASCRLAGGMTKSRRAGRPAGMCCQGGESRRPRVWRPTRLQAGSSMWKISRYVGRLGQTSWRRGSAIRFSGLVSRIEKAPWDPQRARLGSNPDPSGESLPNPGWFMVKFEKHVAFGKWVAFSGGGGTRRGPGTSRKVDASSRQSASTVSAVT